MKRMQRKMLILFTFTLDPTFSSGCKIPKTRRWMMLWVRFFRIHVNSGEVSIVGMVHTDGFKMAYTA